MKKLFKLYTAVFISGCFILFASSCNKVVDTKPKPVNPINNYSANTTLNIAEVDSMANIKNLSCTDSLSIEEKLLTVKGYILKCNIFSSENRFLLYSDSTYNCRVIECKLSTSFLSIYSSINNSFSSRSNQNTWMPMVVKGHITGYDLSLNGDCKKIYKITNITEVGLPN